MFTDAGIYLAPEDQGTAAEPIVLTSYGEAGRVVVPRGADVVVLGPGPPCRRHESDERSCQPLHHTFIYQKASRLPPPATKAE